jgi:hypothetical protein
LIENRRRFGVPRSQLVGRHPWRRDIVKLNRFTAAGWALANRGP